MSEWGQCVTHYICDCQRERMRRLEAVVEAARGIVAAIESDPEVGLLAIMAKGNAAYAELSEALAALDKEVRP